MAHEKNRRQFIKTTAIGAAGLAATTALPKQVIGANDRIRIGLIGCGNRGVGSLMSGALRIAKEQNIEIAALCDVWKVNLEKTKATLAEHQSATPKTYSKYKDLLAQKDIDAVFIATPDFAHAPILVDAIKAKKDVYVEKQMATQFDLAKEALALTKKNKVIVQVGTQLRSYKQFKLGHDLIRSGILGKITHVETNYHHNYAHWARDYSDVRKEDVDWEQYLMYLPQESFSAERFRRWHLFDDFSCGTVGLLGSHYIDMATWYMNDSLPASAVANGGVFIWKDGRNIADTQSCAINYPSEYMLTFCCRFGNKFPNPKIRFYGSKGTFDNQSWTATGDGGGEGALAIHSVVPSQAKEGYNEDDSHIQNWIECMRSRQTPIAPIEAGYAHSVTAIMCFQALKTGKRHIYDTDKMEIREG